MSIWLDWLGNMFIYIVLPVLWCGLWAFATQAVITNRGYDKKTANKWGWIGFFLGIIGLLAALCKPKVGNTFNQTGQIQSLNEADTLLKYKELLDSGAITQEEFDSKKRELLK